MQGGLVWCVGGDWSRWGWGVVWGAGRVGGLLCVGLAAVVDGRQEEK